MTSSNMTGGVLVYMHPLKRSILLQKSNSMGGLNSLLLIPIIQGNTMAHALGTSTVLMVILLVMQMKTAFLSGLRLTVNCKMGVLDLNISGAVSAGVLAILPISWSNTVK